ncbi:MAG: hypothetical protein CME59_23295 [Halioglobus sp.]|nr:hypothetical protein [Halioglobus sp.]
MNTPRVSVIMPVYNAARWVDEAVHSVLSQGVAPLQLIAIDDGSSDDSAARLADFGTQVELLRQDNRGPAAARNLGLAQARAAFIAFIDADDTWPPGRLARQLARLEDERDTTIVQGRLQDIALRDGAWRPRGEPYFANSLVSALFRREAFERAGLLDESLRFCEDVDWFFTARRAGLGLLRDDHVTLLRRCHGDNMTRDRDQVRRQTLAVVARHRRALRGDQP